MSNIYFVFTISNHRSHILIRPMPVIFKINVRRIFLVLTTRSRGYLLKKVATIEKITVRLFTKERMYYLYALNHT